LEERIARLTRELEAAQKQVQDLSQIKKQLENALKSSRSTNQALLNVIPEWIFRIDGEGKFVNYRVAPEVKSPIPDAELLSKTLDDLFPPPIAQLWRDRISQALLLPNARIRWLFYL
jgi:PAS domain-containing protein